MSSAAIDGLNNEMYQVEIRERGGLFYLICKTFNIIESDSSLDLAYAKLVAKRKKISQELASLGVDIGSSDYGYDRAHRTTALQRWTQISIIFMCLGLPLGLLAGTAVFASKASNILMATKNNLKNKVIAVVNNPAELTLLLNKVTEKLDNVTPERREELRLALHKIVVFMKPLVSELQELSNTKN